MAASTGALLELESEMAENRFLDFIGGLPDRVMSSVPDFMLEKTQSLRGEYVEQLSYYQQKNWQGEGKSFLTIPDNAPAHRVIKSVPAGQGRIFQVIKFGSRYHPRHPLLEHQFNSMERNLDAYLVLWRHKEKGDRRPMVLCVHGFMMGQPRRAARMFRIERLLKLGMDVALYIQPFHWRRNPGRKNQLINPYNVPMSIEGFAQNTHDLHSSVLLLNSLGYRRLGLIGASLGGHACALYATTAPLADFMFMVVPAVNIVDYLLPRSWAFPFASGDEVALATREALKVVSPAEYKPNFDMDKVSVVMHTGDRLCKAESVRAWIEKWSIRNVTEVAGGHWFYFNRKARGAAWYGWGTSTTKANDEA
jgi:pimeloyl-ACP methyl ester carboxylesterase